MRNVCQSQSRWSAANFLFLNTSSSFAWKLFGNIFFAPHKKVRSRHGWAGLLSLRMKSRRIMCSVCSCEMWKIITVSIVCFSFFFRLLMFPMCDILRARSIQNVSTSFFLFLILRAMCDANNRLHTYTYTFHHQRVCWLHCEVRMVFNFSFFFRLPSENGGSWINNHNKQNSVRHCQLQYSHLSWR